jgi:hypothetical protein
MSITSKPRIPANWPLWPFAHLLPDRLPHISLRHGQVIWLLTELGFAEGVTRHTFHVYIKSLRKLGIPFGRGRFRTSSRNRLAYYDYLQIMELSLVLSLRVYHVIPDSILKEVVRYRSTLSGFYRRAYSRRRSADGRSIVVQVGFRKQMELRGLFLDLNLKFSGGRLLHFGPPKLLPPSKALEHFGESTAPARRFLPLNLSLLAEQVVALALLAPTVRSGPRPELE